jgi:hypothetical protein
VGQTHWPGGSSLPGFTFGVVGGLIIVFEFLLWPRKKVRAWRLGRAQTWLRAHIWLGLLTVPLILYHSGWRLGGTLSTLLLLLFLIVIASGILGLALQQFLPRRMLHELPAETIYSQIPHISAQLCAEAERLVVATCGPAADLRAAPQQELAAAKAPHLVIGAVRSAGRVQGKVLQTRVPSAPLPGSEPLRDFFEHSVAPFLRGGAAADSPLQSPHRSAVMFQELRTRLDPATHETVAALEDLCDQRRQFDAQARLHFWLHCWLWVHLPLSAALVILMLLHAWVAIKYW